MTNRIPRGPAVQTRVRREIYIGKRDERRLGGVVGFIGGIYEHSDDFAVGGAKVEPYRRARAVFYCRYPEHPNHPAWRPEFDQVRWDALGEAGRAAYDPVLHAAIGEWRAAHPNAVAVHPASADWNPAWSKLHFDPDKSWPARNAFLMAHEAEFRAVPGLWEALRGQLADFMRAHYEPLV